MLNKKDIINEFEKDGYKVSLLDTKYDDVSICFVEVKEKRETFCRIKNSPIYYYIIEGEGVFFINNELVVKKGDLIEILENTKYTYKGNMKMLEMIPKSFDSLEVIDEKI